MSEVLDELCLENSSQLKYNAKKPAFPKINPASNKDIELDINLAKILGLKAQINTGSYQINEDNIVAKLLNISV